MHCNKTIIYVILLLQFNIQPIVLLQIVFRAWSSQTFSLREETEQIYLNIYEHLLPHDPCFKRVCLN